MATTSKDESAEYPTPTSGLRCLATQRPDELETYTHFCADCMSCVREHDSFCHQCGIGRPPDGWTSLRLCEDPWLGRRVADKYDVVSWIARGSMSRVYRVQRKTGMSRHVLKVSRVDERLTELREVELSPWPYIEADTQTALTNPHIVHIIDVLDLPGGRVGLVMEHVDGCNVKQLIDREGPLDTPRALDLLTQTADGIHEAHRAGIVHRDLKPSNIMVESLPDGDEFVRILDFGIACPSGSQPDAPDFIGTPAFASPEQIRNSELAPTSDIYSMGAVLFYMLTGRPPFGGENTSQVLQAHLSDNPPSLSRVCERAFPPEVERLVRQMLSKKPMARPRTVPSLIGEVDALRAQVDLAGGYQRSTSSTLRDRSEADTMEITLENPDAS